jgi:uncharacterized protein YjbJ (UPF0337 family)
MIQRCRFQGQWKGNAGGKKGQVQLVMALEWIQIEGEWIQIEGEWIQIEGEWNQIEGKWIQIEGGFK